jgi:hypothetical protein
VHVVGEGRGGGQTLPAVCSKATRTPPIGWRVNPGWLFAEREGLLQKSSASNNNKTHESVSACR